MEYIIGIDGGGTKTEGVLTDLAGTILARRITGATNPNDVTLPVSVERLHILCMDLLHEAGLSGHHLPTVSVFGGIAGGINHGSHLENALREKMPTVGHLAIRSDIHILLTGELPTGDGACIICGTGSACFFRREADIIRIGGWGYLLDSGGSGYDIGRDALEAVLRAFDGRGEKTCLTELLTEHLGGAVNTRITEIYSEGKPYIAACAPLVFKAARLGDTVAEAILTRNARKLAEYAEAAWKWAAAEGRTPPETLPVVMGGGISVKEAPHWQARILALTSPDVPLSLTVAEMPPVFGAVVEALKQTEEGSNTDFSALRAHFREEYGKIVI
jgi:N-acetylglucosamine kinase-like BadF-type ATPase